MKNIINLLMATGMAITTVNAQTAVEKEAIKNLCGCYEVDFKYAETFTTDTAYKIAKPYHVGGLEYALAEENGNKKIVIQHLLVIDDSTVIKHWREDWEFEKADWWIFNHDATWTHETNAIQPVKGQWTQTVWEVDDAPRYQGTGNWVSSNNKYYWESTTDAPLPRREYSHRSDYNVLQRTNRIQPTPTGWLHEQDNKKIIRKDGEADTYLAEEKGYNNYIKQPDSKCAVAAAWWKEHREFWNAVRMAWTETLAGRKSIRLQPKANGLLLYQKLDEVEKQKLAGTSLSLKLKEVLGSYVVKSDSKSVAGITPAK